MPRAKAKSKASKAKASMAKPFKAKASKAKGKRGKLVKTWCLERAADGELLRLPTEQGEVLVLGRKHANGSVHVSRVHVTLKRENVHSTKNRAWAGLARAWEAGDSWELKYIGTTTGSVQERSRRTAPCVVPQSHSTSSLLDGEGGRQRRAGRGWEGRREAPQQRPSPWPPERGRRA